MKIIEYIGFEEKNCERMAARHGLTFHCDGYFITVHDDDREAREATEPELAMWRRLVGDFDSGFLPATLEEITDRLKYRKGPFVLNAVDAATLRQLKDKFRPCLDRDDLKRGLIGWLCRPPCSYPNDHFCYYPTEAAIYVSRAIQVGYYFEGEPPAAILPCKIEDGPRRLASELPEEVDIQVGYKLQPFILGR